MGIKNGDARQVSRLCICSEGVEACSVQACEGVLGFGSVRAVGGDDCLAVATDVVVVTKEGAEGPGVKDRPEEAGDGELDHLHFGNANNVLRDSGV